MNATGKNLSNRKVCTNINTPTDSATPAQLMQFYYPSIYFKRKYNTVHKLTPETLVMDPAGNGQ